MKYPLIQVALASSVLLAGVVQAAEGDLTFNGKFTQESGQWIGSIPTPIGTNSSASLNYSEDNDGSMNGSVTYEITSDPNDYFTIQVLDTGCSITDPNVNDPYLVVVSSVITGNQLNCVVDVTDLTPPPQQPDPPAEPNGFTVEYKRTSSWAADDFNHSLHIKATNGFETPISEHKLDKREYQYRGDDDKYESTVIGQGSTETSYHLELHMGSADGKKCYIGPIKNTDQCKLTFTKAGDHDYPVLQAFDEEMLEKCGLLDDNPEDLDESGKQIERQIYPRSADGGFDNAYHKHFSRLGDYDHGGQNKGYDHGKWHDKFHEANYFCVVCTEDTDSCTKHM